MDTQNIIETVQNIFIGADERQWQLCIDAFSETVHVDYTSLAGGEPADVQAADLVTAWRGVLPGFQATHHQLGNFSVKHTGNSADVFFYGTATHFLPNDSGSNIWTTVGTYNAHLEKTGEAWKVTSLKFNLKYQDGNLSLPALAQQRAQ